MGILQKNEKLTKLIKDGKSEYYQTRLESNAKNLKGIKENYKYLIELQK